jgi:hypothetical protein
VSDGFGRDDPDGNQARGRLLVHEDVHHELPVTAELHWPFGVKRSE